MERTLTVKQIKYFVAAYESGSLRRAAERLEVSQPALTAQIAALERSLGVELFERTRTGVVPTPAARELLTGARQILEDVRGMMDTASSIAGHVAGTYRLGVTPTLGPYLLPRILPDIHERYGSLRLIVRESDPAQLLNGLLNSDYDLILSTQPIRSDDVELQPLFRESLRLVIPSDHRLANKKSINREDLINEEVLAIEEHHLYYRQIAELCNGLGARLRHDYQGTSLDAVRQMVVMGMGVAFLPALYIASEIRERDSLRVANVSGVNVHRDHVLAWRRRSPSRQLFRKLANEIRELVLDQLCELVTVV